MTLCKNIIKGHFSEPNMAVAGELAALRGTLAKLLPAGKNPHLTHLLHLMFIRQPNVGGDFALGTEKIEKSLKIYEFFHYDVSTFILQDFLKLNCNPDEVSLCRGSLLL